MKDLFIPISIVIAGMCIGAGLYFGGSSAPKAPAAPVDNLTALALAAGVDENDYRTCVDTKDTAAAVDADAADAVETGGTGTPWAILVGPTGKKYKIEGALPQSVIEQLINVALAEAGQTTDAENKNLENMDPVTADDHRKGPADAAITIVEYSDFDCPFCTRFHTVMNTLVASRDDVAWVYRHFPLDTLHPEARSVAIAAECVAKLGGNEAFWTFADGYLR